MIVTVLGLSLGSDGPEILKGFNNAADPAMRGMSVSAEGERSNQILLIFSHPIWYRTSAL